MNNIIVLIACTSIKNDLSCQKNRKKTEAGIAEKKNPRQTKHTHLKYYTKSFSMARLKLEKTLCVDIFYCSYVHIVVQTQIRQG